MWAPSVEQICTLLINFGLRGGDFPICEYEVAALQVFDHRRRSAVRPSSDMDAYVQAKMTHTLKLIDTLLRHCEFELRAVELLLQVIFTTFSDQNYWIGTKELLSVAKVCVVGLMDAVAQQQRADVIRRITEFCLQIKPDLASRHFMVAFVCPFLEHRELSIFMAYRILEDMFLKQPSNQKQASSSHDRHTSTVPLLPTLRDVYMLVSPQDFSTISKNRLVKQTRGMTGLLNVLQVIQLIRKAMDTRRERTTDGKVRNLQNIVPSQNMP